MLIYCNYAKQTWNILLANLEVPIHHLHKIPQIYTSWHRIYPFVLRGKKGWKTIWMAIPKFTCWKIWLARNQSIFLDARPTPIQTTRKAKGLLLEAISSSGLNWDQGLNKQENTWMNISQNSVKKHVICKPKNKDRWTLKINIQEFIEWRKK